MIMLSLYFFQFGSKYSVLQSETTMADQDSTSLGEIILNVSSNGLKAIKCCLIRAGNNWKIIFDSSTACKVNLIKGGQWILRLDGPHRGADFEHININPAYWGIPDPHTALPSGGLRVISILTLITLTGNRSE